MDTYHSPYREHEIPTIVQVGPYSEKSVWSFNEQFDNQWFESLASLNYNPEEEGTLLNAEDLASAKEFSDILGRTNMQGYGVTFKYNLTIHNLGNKNREFSYYAELARRYFITCSVNGVQKPLNTEMYMGEGTYKGNVYTIELPANSTVNIVIEATEYAGAFATNKNFFKIN